MTEPLSRSEQKRAAKRIEDAAEELSALSDNDLKKFPANPEIHAEIVACRGLKGGARKRQIKYLAKVLRQMELDDIYTFLAERKGSDLRAKKIFHEAERLRDALINEAMDDYHHCREMSRAWEPTWESDLIDDIHGRYPDLNITDLRKSIFQYVKSRNIVHYRELFRMLKAVVELNELYKKSG